MTNTTINDVSTIGSSLEYQTVVLKFGGSSQCEKGMPSLLNSVRKYHKEGKRVILVISAIQKTTNMLYDIVFGRKNTFNDINQLHKDFCTVLGINFYAKVNDILTDLFADIDSLEVVDFPSIDSKRMSAITQLKLKIISYGELLAITCVGLYLEKHGIPNLLVDAHRFIINGNTSDTIDNVSMNIKGRFHFDVNKFDVLTNDVADKVIITQGFVASTSDNGYCILTRSGSNTSAALIAFGTKAERLEIWTDVSGLYTADPRKVINAKTISNISYDMCQEAAAMGSQVIHPFSIKPCQVANIPIHIRNTFNAESEGTVISNISADNVYLIACQRDVTIFNIESLDMWESYGIASDIFNEFNKERIDVNIITTSQFSVSTTTNDKSDLKINKVKTTLSQKYSVNTISDCVIVSIIANNTRNNNKLRETHAVLSGKFEHLIHMIHYGANNLSLSFVVNKNVADELIQTLHDELV